MLKIFTFFTLSLAWASGFAQAPATASLSAPKVFSEQPVAVQKAISPEIQLHANQLAWSLDQENVHGSLIVDVVLSTLNKFHLYEERTSFSVDHESSEFWQLKVLQKPTPTRFFDPVSKSLVPGYVGQALFRLELTPKNATAAKVAQDHGLAIIASFQACSDTICLFPANLILKVDLNANAPRAAEKNNESFFSQSRLEGLIQNQLGDSWWAFVILFLAGILTAFTPCVYPMYPITIGIFSRWSTEKATSPLLLSFLYCLGITLSYALLGLITAATGAVFGSLTQSPWFLISIGLILFASAILFSGIVEFSLPTKLINRIAGSNSKLGPKTQSLVFGATLGIVASPCVGPVLIAVLSWTSAIIAAKDVNSYILGFSYLAIFGLGMSFPFLIMSQMILKMKMSPSFGRWTPWIKRIGTILLLGSSLYFLVPGFKYLRMQQMASQNSSQESLIKTYSYFDAPKGKPMLIDFRADWCVACLEIEAKTLTNPKVVEYFNSEQASLIKVDLTVLTPDNEGIAKKFGVISLPALIFVGSDGEVCQSLSTYEFINADDLMQKLASCP
jgi:thiol:disulfide interchange protein